MENLEFLKDFIDEELIIRKDYDGSYRVWTIKTQQFKVDSLSELTYERFVEEENIQKEMNK
jgi:hypothetical protein